MALFMDRTRAGEKLSAVITALALPRSLVLAIPRGGVPVAAPIVRALICPFDTLPVRKIGAPFNPEFAIAAIGPYGIELIDEEAIAQSGNSRATIGAIEKREREELERRERLYKMGSYSAGYIPKTVIIVDDGIATALTARAAVLAARKKYPRAKIIFAAPVSLARERDLEGLADKLVILERPTHFYAISQAFDHFPQVNDSEVISLLESRGAL